MEKRSNIKWFDFRDARNPTQEENKLEVQARRSGASIKPVTAPSPKQMAPGVTKSEVHGAHKAAAERGSGGAGSAKHKRCKKGKSCGATCIFYNDDCLLVFPDPGVQESLGKVRDMLRDMVQRGAIGEEGAEGVFKSVAGLDTEKIRKLPKTAEGEEADLRPVKGKSGKDTINPALKDQVASIRKRAEHLQEGMKLLEKDIPDPKERQKAFDQFVGKMYNHTYGKPKMDDIDTVEGISSPKHQNIVNKGAKLYEEFVSGTRQITPQNVQDALSGIAKDMKVREPSEWEVKIGLGLMSSSAATYLGKAGSVDKGGVFTPGQKLTELPKEFAPTSKASEAQQAGRREFILRTLLSQDFKDVYSGQPMHTANMDLEHFLPFSRFGTSAEVGNNYYATTMSSNRKKGDRSPDYFSVKNPDGYFQVKPGTKTKPAELAQFDSKGKLTPDSKKVFEDVFQGKGRLKSLSEEILGLQLNPKEAVAAIASLKVTPAEKAGLVAKLVSAQLTNLTGIKVPYTAAVGMQSGGRAPQPWYWYGKDLEGSKFGNLVNSKMVQMVESGDNRKLLQLAKIMSDAQKAQLAINEVVRDGVRIRETEAQGETRIEIASMMKQSRDSFISAIEAL